ncbi:hypothetical protein WJ96_04835 [Burkholderia ubonensis]|uniref:Uncharacterized protein n=1 Tax=Burkholderia ubonensis TaxID=101571 RepID=A0AAW3MSK6_9BURK|nr:hypothetical protein [Burkholderia ubonensis]KVP75094.1 hypothetical protein WJ93_06675 [Burkholderia ubonensis]KVP97899.1 hypothetical protein WJ96_04835 [Burkholderia ubonensis]KVZ92596.1 hypothetical protein WL25_16490 [Burkholderia ubonensis]
MKSVRVVSVGFLLAGALMILSGQEFFGGWMRETALNAWILATSTILPTTAHVAGIPMVSPTAFAFICLGVGMFLSATVYSVLDDLVFSILYGGPALLARGVTGLAGRFGSKRRYVAYGDF